MRQWILDTLYSEDSDNPIAVINAHRQYGKSTAMFEFAVSFAIKNANSVIKIGGPYQNQINDIIDIVMNTVLQHCPPDLKPRFVKNQFKFKNGSRIRLVGVDLNANALRGTPNDLVILDEVGFMKDLNGLVFDIIMPTFITRPNGRLIMISTPPAVLVHDYSARFMPKAKLDGNYWELKITDNPQYNESQIEHFAKAYDIIDVEGNVLVPGKDTDKFKREFLCEVVPDVDRLVFPEWQHFKGEGDAHQLVKDNIQPPSHYKPIVVADWGFKDHTGIVYGWINWHEGTLHVKQETFVNYKTAYDISLMVKDKVQEVFPGIEETEIMFWLDSDLSLLSEVRKYTGFHWQTCNGWVKVNKEGNINGIRELIGKSKMFVDSQCKNLIAQLDGGVWNIKRTDWERSDAMGHLDMLAALIYMNRVAPWKENPTPPRKKITGNHEVFVSPKFDLDNYSDKHEGFRKAFGGFK